MSKETVIDPVVVAESRSNVYRLLSVLYLKEVTPEFLAILKSKKFIGPLNDLGVDIEKVLCDVSEEKLVDTLAQEYAALFIVPGGIPPYESVRLKGLLCQEPAWQVKEFYKSYGLNVKEDSKIFPDHLGMELEFMAYLTDKESKAWKDNDEKALTKWCNLQKDFFSNHLDKWVFGFLGDLDRCAFHPFYQEVSKVTRGFLEVEREDIGTDSAVRPVRKGGAF